MPSFASALESTLHKALEAACSRRHEYATLEHLLLALVDDEHASKVMTCVRRRSGRAQEHRRALSRYRARGAEGRGRDRSLADQRLPARRPARDPACPVLGPRRSHRRQRARRPVLRTRELRGLFPPAAGHEPPRRGELHQPRRRQGRRRPPRPRRPRAPTKRRRPRARASGQGRERAQAVHRRSQREGQGRQGRSADRPRAGGRPDDPDPVPPHRRTTRSMSAIPASARPRSPKGWRARSSRATCPRCCCRR